MMWLLFSFISAFFLGLYDTSKKVSVNENAVIPVLFLNTLFCFLFTTSLLFLSWYMPERMRLTPFFVQRQNLMAHGLMVVKSMIVLTSWGLAYSAMKHLPLTLTAPITATRPVLTLLGALFIFDEHLNGFQWMGVSITIFSFYLLSLAGKKEGIKFEKNRWIFLLVIATMVGAISGLYDKFLLCLVPPVSVQVYNNIYQLIIMGIVMLLFWYPHRKENTPFHWTWGIFCISIFITLADFLYFYALSYRDSMISIVSMVRRGSVIVSFFSGVFLFKERNLKAKVIDLILLLIGMIFLCLGTH